MNLEFKKRIITSIFLFSLLILMYFYDYILIIGLVVISIIVWIEFYALISKIFHDENFKNRFFRIFFKISALIYLLAIVILILYVKIEKPDLEILIIYSLLVAICSDLGGITFGKIFKGKKLTKFSPNKTISGSIGSFCFSLFLIPSFRNLIMDYNLISLVIITLLISLSSQVGDIIISSVKRKARVKDTSDLLPGHGGFLDRVDGVIFALPVGFLLFNLL